MGVSPFISHSTYEPLVVGRIAFAPPFDSKAGREVLAQRRRSAEKARAGVSNPNPRRFDVTRVEGVGCGLVVEVVYPDCTTYEGRKVLVFAHTREIDVRAATVLDPHFTDHAPAGALVPVARFEPTDRGWQLARICAAAL